jgi:hypothetical protein
MRAHITAIMLAVVAVVAEVNFDMIGKFPAGL